ncbi:sarcosine oxidase subunit gamma [Roseovarius phycicola]|uniref:Sarcosine oxidase subunit gamma n=1 Tax=Roseovarius phycicola TaxID=3080976 RepID=A0ABZ2HKJ2_9RHOB
MAEYKLIAEPPLAGYDETFGNVRLVSPADFALVSIALPLGDEAKALKAIKTGYGVDVPEVGHSAISKDGNARLLRMAQDQAFVVFTHDQPDAAAIVAKRVKAAVYVTDQTDVWTALHLSGASSRHALERICPIDLHADVFAEGHVARTVMEHLGVMVVRDAQDSFVLLSASSSAGSFLHAVETSIRNVM